jgi:hypothetical protein
LIGVGGFDLEPAAADQQLELLDSGRQRGERLDRALDQVNARFGPGAVKRARDLASDTVLESAANLDFLDDEAT